MREKSIFDKYWILAQEQSAIAGKAHWYYAPIIFGMFVVLYPYFLFRVAF